MQATGVGLVERIFPRSSVPRSDPKYQGEPRAPRPSTEKPPLFLCSKIGPRAMEAARLGGQLAWHASGTRLSSRVWCLACGPRVVPGDADNGRSI
jgi:hypothetical protein